MNSGGSGLNFVSRFWADLPLRVKGLVVVSLPVAALLLSTVLINQLERQKSDSETRVTRAMNGRAEVWNAYAALVSAESGIRKYALTGDREALLPVESARGVVDSTLDRVGELVQDNPEQVRRVPQMRAQIHKYLDILRELRVYYDAPETRGTQPPEALLHTWKAATEETVRELKAAYDAENQVVGLRTKGNTDRQKMLQAVIVGSGVIGLIGGILSMLLFTRGIVSRVQQLEAGASRIEKGLPANPGFSGSDELGGLAQALERTGNNLVARDEELKLALESGLTRIWEMEPRSGRISYHAGSEALKSANYPEEMTPETVEEWIAGVHPDDREHVRRMLDWSLTGPAAVQIEYRVPLRSGEIRWMLVKVRYYAGAEGRPPRLLGLLVDISERKNAAEEISRQAMEIARSEDAFQRQARVLQLILDSMVDAVVVADHSGKFVLFNPAAERILRRGEVYGGPDAWSAAYGVLLPDKVTMCPPADLPLARAIRGESVDGMELYLLPAGAEEGTWISVTARPLREPNGDFHGGAAVFHDITQAKNAAEALKIAKLEAERANQAKSEFLSRMSHELRTPLNSILGFAQLLELSSLSAEQSDNVEHIVKGGYHLLELINEVLDLARIEAGRLGLSPEPVRMREALKDALDLVRPLALQQQVDISPDVAIRCDRHVHADRQRLKQVLLNLLSNAIKFNRPGGNVRLGCEVTAENRLRIEISDTGIGMSPEGLQQIFKPFERLGADVTGVEGTGLGLALSRRLINAMGGTIGVESQLGVGSRFHIELALMDSQDAWFPESGPAAIQVPASGASEYGTVLYIEDNLSNLRLMERILAHRPGVTLISAMQGQLGLDLAQMHFPDWILLDLHLPDIAGEEVLNRLRMDPRTERIPVTVVSADATPGQIERLVAAGANGYLTKPLDVRKFFALLEKTLKRGGSFSPETVGSHAERNYPQ